MLAPVRAAAGRIEAGVLFIAQMPSRQRDEHVLERGGSGPQLGQRQALADQLGEQGGNGQVELRGLHPRAIGLELGVAHARQPAEAVEIERPGAVAPSRTR